jgi:hypothetical protein
MPNQIPQTRVRLKGFVSLQAFRGGLFLDYTGNIADQIAAAQASNGLVTIGAAAKLAVDEIREENSFFRQFIVDPAHPENAAKPAETFPGLIRFEIHLSRVDLYDANLFEAFGISGHLVGQNKPLVLFVNQAVPDITIANSPTGNPAKKLEPQTTIVTGVWLNSLPRMFDITDTNQSFLAEVDGIAADVI